MSKEIEDVFISLIDKNYPNVKPIPVKLQIYKNKSTFEETFKSIILHKAKTCGYYK